MHPNRTEATALTAQRAANTIIINDDLTGFRVTSNVAELALVHALGHYAIVTILRDLRQAILDLARAESIRAMSGLTCAVAAIAFDT